nr:GAF domain-containing protein [Falsirhodobacter halotolerans]
MLDALGILDTPVERSFDNLALLARLACRTPIALISLLDRDRQWFKAASGTDLIETPLSQSICAFTVAQGTPLVIHDLRLDERTANNTLVTEGPEVRFYAGVPLRVHDVLIGALCVMDYVPRPQGLTEDELLALTTLSQQISTEITMRQRQVRWVSDVEQHNASLRLAAEQSRALADLGDRLRGARTAAEVVTLGSACMADVLRPTRAGFGIVDEVAERVEMQPEWRMPGVSSLAGTHHFRDYGSFLDDLKRSELVIIPDVAEDERTKEQAKALLDIGIRVLINVPIFHDGEFTLVSFVHFDWPRPLSDADVVFIRAVSDRIHSALMHLRSEEDRRIANHEMSHRLKNTFAMITAVARQTFGAMDKNAVAIFSSRLGAMASAYDLLAHERWVATQLGAIIAGTVQVAGGADRVLAVGPDVDMGSEVALSTTMLLHELTTNAMKYGALSVPGGRVHIDWSIEDRHLVLTWTETGGPPPNPTPGRKGFGSRLIQAGLGSGDADIDYLPTGLRATFRAPMERLSR